MAEFHFIQLKKHMFKKLTVTSFFNKKKMKKQLIIQTTR